MFLLKKYQIINFKSIIQKFYTLSRNIKPVTCVLSHVFSLIVIIILGTAMRLQKILNLNFKNIDYNRSVIKVINTKSSKYGIIPINDLAIETLKNIEKKSEFVFYNPKTGKPYYSIKTAFSKILKKDGLIGVRFHDLRHNSL